MILGGNISEWHLIGQQNWYDSKIEYERRRPANKFSPMTSALSKAKSTDEPDMWTQEWKCLKLKKSVIVGNLDWKAEKW